MPRDHQADFIVIEDKNGKVVYRQGVWYSLQIIGYAWSSDSRSIAVAESSSHMSLRPLDVLAALSGHPIPEYTFYVMPYRIDGKAAWQLPYCREGSRNGFGVIVGWK